ncbi:hypothetical protein RM704_06735 [Streptomyces sp. DSM 3412]|uniref:Uncharacterized protein n=1 Tax=Streptomyces gottesmaniae TaxID=3075518 RepID=A0ABU2YS54_9ACTN|nr:hypothetical protein [Streptomyces sp. DSM 3412]MDT0567160.1 hypothetical protein [Streptomyces sp. DSM 3412]
MSYIPAELVSRVSSCLIQAGFHVLGDADRGIPGLRVTEVSAGALVSWTASDGFTALSRDQAGRATSHDSMRVIVQAAVAGLLVQLGHTVTEMSDAGGLMVRTEAVFRRSSKGS